MVRLLLMEEAKVMGGAVSFNPTMVRLLPFRHAVGISACRVSIPQWCDCCHFGMPLAFRHAVFQSHNGAIAAIRSADVAAFPYLGFNPTMVRLLLDGHVYWLLIQLQFQSHNGAIAARYR